MIRPLPLTIWSCGLLLIVLLVAAARPADVDGGPPHVFTPMVLLAAVDPVGGAGPLPATPASATAPARLPATDAALATPIAPSVVAALPTSTATAEPPAAPTSPPTLAAVSPTPATPVTPPVLRRWTFADGWTGPGFDEALVITNPTRQAARARVIYHRPDQPPLTRVVVVDARGQRTVTVTDEVDGVGRNGGQGWSVTTDVESLDSDDLTVERVLRLRFRLPRPTPPG